jgi:hypothetical protein
MKVLSKSNCFSSPNGTIGTIAEKVSEGPEKIVSAKVGKSWQKIGKPRQTLKNTKYIYFFQNFKHIKQQQH